MEKINCLLCGNPCIPPKPVVPICEFCFKRQEEHFLQRAENEGYTAPDAIEPGLWLGGQGSGFLEKPLVERGIRNILIVGNMMKKRFPDKFNYMQIEIEDDEEEDLLTPLPSLVKFIEDAVARHESILVHCQGGISRSGSVVIAYIMKSHKLPMEKAWEYVKKKRSCVYPNRGFQKQLLEYQKQLGIPPEPIP